jgi:predicted alpha/beta-hydrolase family hydrolase
MEPWVRALGHLGVDAIALDLPKARADAAVAVMRVALEEHPGPAVGGHSYGGRVASMLAAEAQVQVRALILLSYPLHRPGHPDELRTEHWRHISCPVLVISGERDPFARVDLLRREIHTLQHAELITYTGQGHGLLRVLDDAAQRIARFLTAIA